jgi:hypothetical protein
MTAAAISAAAFGGLCEDLIMSPPMFKFGATTVRGRTTPAGVGYRNAQIAWDLWQQLHSPEAAALKKIRRVKAA